MKGGMKEHIRECIMLSMFNCPKNNRREIIPAGYVPIDKVDHVLRELGFEYLVL